MATHLYKAIKPHREVCLINPRTLEGFPVNPEMVILSVSDKAIVEVANRLPHSDAIIAHTAGSVQMDVLNDISNKRGVFYPLQTFTKDVDLNYEEIPVYVEGSDTETISALKELAATFTKTVKEADSDQRKKLHLASVFACNFTNALMGVSYQLLDEAGIDFSDILPLISQTVNKLKDKTPKEAQTGPAVRYDQKVIETHLRMLKSRPDFQDIYIQLTNLIQSGTAEI